MKLKTKFQDEDFDLGEVVEANIYHGGDGKFKVIAEPAKGGLVTFYFNTLKEMNEMFEDGEEPKGYWTVDCGEAIEYAWQDNKLDRAIEAVGLKFSTKEECERAIEKLKAWKRLRDKGFRFDGYDVAHKSNGNLAGQIFYDAGNYPREDVEKEMDLLFGGEE